jgi:PAS domain S-box-containing protein
MVWQLDPEGRSTYFNQAWLDFTGRAVDQAAATRWAVDVHPNDVERCRATYVEACKAGQDFELQYRLRRHDGEYRHVLDRGTPLRSDEDTFLGYVGGCMDITERTRIEGWERDPVLDGMRARIIEELREHASQAIFAAALVGASAVAELGRLVRGFQQRTGIEADLVMTGGHGPLPPETTETLKLLVGEALGSIERCATATAVVLGLRVSQGTVALTIQDDVGFLVRTCLPQPSTGL